MGALSGINLDFRIPTQEYAGRERRVLEEMQARRLDLGIGYATPFMPGAMQYLTGFDPHIETAALAVGATGVYILGGPEVEALARPAIRHGQIRTLLEFQILPQLYAHASYQALRDVLREVTGGEPVRRVGILVRKEFLPLHWLEMLKTAIGSEIELVDASDILDEMRYCKSEAEMDAFRQSSRIATAAMKAMLEVLRPGMRELEVAAVADCVVKEAGAHNFGYDTIVMSGPRINTIVGRATNKVIEDGEVVSLGVSPRFEGYTSTLGRTVVAGRARADQIAFLDHGNRAFEIAVTHLRAGEPAGALETAVADYFRQVGLYEYVSYSVMHGIGLTEVLDERVPRGTQLIPAGATFMLDVGLFFHPVFHGLRHEDPFIVHRDGTVEHPTDLPMTVYRR
jgi:Xaa-Pro aminopeptidase